MGLEIEGVEGTGEKGTASSTYAREPCNPILKLASGVFESKVRSADAIQERCVSLNDCTLDTALEGGDLGEDSLSGRLLLR